MSQRNRRTVLKQSGAVIAGLTGLSQTVAADSDSRVEPEDTESWPITLDHYVDMHEQWGYCPTINKGMTYTFKNLEFELTYGDLQLVFWDGITVGYRGHYVKTVEYDGTYNVEAPADIPYQDAMVGVEVTGDNAEITSLSCEVQPIWMD